MFVVTAAFPIILAGKRAPNTGCSGQVGTVRVFERFHGFVFFPFRRRLSSHPPATNARRWAAVEEKELLT